MSTHYVYRCYDSEGRLLYIGCTQDLAARMAVHECDIDNPASRELMPRLHRVEYVEYPDRESALAAEREAIELEAPLLNTHHNGGRGMRDLPPVERTRMTDEQRAEMNRVLGLFASPSTSVPCAVSPSVRGTEYQPRFITAAEWLAKYGKKVAS